MSNIFVIRNYFTFNIVYFSVNFLPQNLLANVSVQNNIVRCSSLKWRKCTSEFLSAQWFELPVPPWDAHQQAAFSDLCEMSKL